MIVEYRLQLGTEQETISFAVDGDNVIIATETPEVVLKATISLEDFYKIANTMQDDFPLDVAP
jgi:hypothetical protein